MSAMPLHVRYLASFVNASVQTPIISTVFKPMLFTFAGALFVVQMLKIRSLWCRQTHNCGGSCQAAGICEIETAPQSIEATFTGRHETFQYTKVCVIHPNRCGS
jgi:hypothetical protein